MRNWFRLTLRILLGFLIAFLILIAYLGYSAGQVRKAEEAFHTPLTKSLSVTSTTFSEGGSLPIRCTCEGGDTRPAIQVDSFPPGTQSVVLIATDPDAPSPAIKLFHFMHWAVVDLPPTPLTLPEAAPADPIPNGFMLKNGFGAQAFIGPCPPFGEHRYIFRVYALNAANLHQPVDASYTDLIKAMDGKVISYGELVGVYQK